MRKLLALAAGTLALASLAIALPDHPAWSQAARTIRIILPVPPGGSIDVLARILADHVSAKQVFTPVRPCSQTFEEMCIS